jgi:5'(3')-deoxyribonucleotidase
MKIAVDLDAVLVDPVPLYLRIFEKVGQTFDDFCLPTTWGFDNWTKEARDEIINEFRKDPPDLMIQLPVFPMAKSVLQAMKNIGHHVEIVTSRVKHVHTFQYIYNLFPMVDWIEVVGLGQSKIEYLNANNFDLWIDDYPQHGEDFKGRIALISNSNTLYNYHLREQYEFYNGIESVVAFALERHSDLNKVYF